MYGSFTPVVFSAYGGCGRETHHFLSLLGEKIALKKNLAHSIVMSWLSKKIAFSLCVRAAR
jgi:hypothetical protein